MKYLWLWFGGFLVLRLKGRQIHRFLNLCSRNGIGLWCICRNLDNCMGVKIRLKDFYCIKPYLRKTRTTFRIVGKKGFPFWCHRHPYLKWMPVLVMAAVVLYLYSTTYIWDIQIQGNSRVTDGQLLELLEQYEVTVGAKSKNVDCAQVEYHIRENFEELGWVSVYMNHTRLCIEVRESLYDEHEDRPDDNRRYDLVADKEARIVSMVTRAGKAAVKPGMVVQPGDLLVEGTCDIVNDAGEVAQTLQMRAEAYIIGDVEYTTIIPINEFEILSLKISGLYSDKALFALAEKKLSPKLLELEENGVIILDKNVMIYKEEQRIFFVATIYAREEIGMNIPVEELEENEPE